LNVCNLHLTESEQVNMNLTILKSKMKSLTQIISALVLAIYATAALAFDINTHAAMTAKAIEQSKITSTPNNSDVLKKLGLYDKNFALGTSYLDIGNSINRRNTTGFEQKVIDDVGETQKTGLTLPAAHTIPGWIIRGAIREDDNTIETPPGTPEGDEPGGVFQRSYAHFFDPQNDRPLTLLGERGPKSPDWALEPDKTISGRANHYNIPSAREAMWRALTLKKLLPNKTLESILPGGNNFGADAAEDERKAYWATMFRAVGDVVHLLQDAAQPQHTRNDAHSGLGCDPRAFQDTCLAGHDSFVEKYLKARTLRATSFNHHSGVQA
jgi:hypothetical protein